MSARYNLLRLLVVAGSVPLLLRGPRVAVVRAHTQDCTNIYSVPNTACVAPCTGTYTDHYAEGTGFQYADQNTTPCGGTGCIQPHTLGPMGWECKACCLANGDTCAVNECNGENPCCATCDPDKLKCCVENGYPCTSSPDCCYSSCLSGFCQYCAYLGESCNINANNCCTPGQQCSIYTATCCIPVGMSGCSTDSDCCPGGYHCQNGTCKCTMTVVPAGAGLLRLPWL